MSVSLRRRLDRLAPPPAPRGVVSDEDIARRDQAFDWEACWRIWDQVMDPYIAESTPERRSGFFQEWARNWNCDPSSFRDYYAAKGWPSADP